MTATVDIRREIDLRDPGSLVTPATCQQILDTMFDWITKQSYSHYVIFFEGNLLRECYRTPPLLEALRNADFVLADGASVQLLAQQAHRKPIDRLPGPDLMPRVCQEGLRLGCRHFFYGSSQDTLEKLVSSLKQRYPTLSVAGTYSPPFTSGVPLNADEHIAIINQTRPDIVWVSLGGPKQELWMASHAKKVTAPVLLGVGAAFDFIAGTRPRAPKWVRRLGAEWVFRFAFGGTRITLRNLKVALFGIRLFLGQLIPVFRPLQLPCQRSGRTSNSTGGQNLPAREHLRQQEQPQLDLSQANVALRDLR